MKRILITGGIGFVGGRLAKKLSKDNEVIVASRKQVEEPILQQHGNIASVIHDSLLVAESFSSNIDTVIHLAALNEWDSVQYPSEAIRVNIDETRIILENALLAGVTQFIYFSTAHVYGSSLKGRITEETVPHPIHPYAITHKAAEDYVIAAALQKKIKGIVVRLSNSFGAPVIPSVNRWTLLANDLCRQAIEKKSLTLHSNGCQYRDFICLTDVENIIAAMIDQPGDFTENIYNLGSGKAMRVIDMAKAIATAYASLFGKEIPIILPESAVALEEPFLEYSIDRLTVEGCNIKNDLKSELEQLLLFCQQNFTIPA